MKNATRHLLVDMPAGIPAPMDWVRLLSGLKDAGWRQVPLARRLGVHQSAISRWNAGLREPQGEVREKLLALASEVGLIDDARPPRNMITVVADIGAGASIDPDFEQLPLGGIEIIQLPYDIPDGMIAFRVVGDSMSPAYEQNEIVVVEREQPYAVENMVGLRAAVRTRDKKGTHRRYLKRIARGSKTKLFNLESINDEAETIRDVTIVWASPVRLVIPNIGLQRISK
ncbi:MAG: helix-turn-helix domain-containing protein [Rhodopseudomonas sp.]|nr:helix-turn-helix domain-containing protein [Rhodopseudomonas sp.]